MGLNFGREGYTQEQALQFQRQLLERIEGLPGVQAATIARDRPVSFGLLRSVFLEGQEPAPGGRGVLVQTNDIGPRYFETLGIPVVSGRSFTTADRDSAPPVIIVSSAMARRFWAGLDPIGRRVRLGDETSPQATVVGAVGTARFRDLTTDLSGPRSEPDIFVPFAQVSDVDLALVVRTSTSQESLIAAVQREVTALDASLPLFRVARMSDLVARQTAAARFGSTVLASFSVVAMVLAAIGIYGVLAFVIGLSRREIAIRLALGATQARVVWLIVRQAMVLVGAGLAAGLVVAYYATNALSTQLFRVSATDPATFAVVSLVLAAVALAASYLPSRTAAGIDPQLALKSD